MPTEARLTPWRRLRKFSAFFEFIFRQVYNERLWGKSFVFILNKNASQYDAYHT